MEDEDAVVVVDDVNDNKDDAGVAAGTLLHAAKDIAADSLQMGQITTEERTVRALGAALIAARLGKGKERQGDGKRIFGESIYIFFEHCKRPV